MLSKDFPVFDCDAHVVEPPALLDFVPEGDRDMLRNFYWTSEDVSPLGLLNGRRTALITPGYRTAGMGGSVRGPGCPPTVQRALYTRPGLTPEQIEYLDHKGARDPRARLADMDVMGIDQVLVIPTMVNNYLYFLESAHAARTLCRALNDWAFEYCQAAPDRLFPCANLPIHFLPFALEELVRVAEKGFKVVSIRPIDAQGLYPNQPAFDLLWSTIQDLGLVVGMHTFPAGEGPFVGNRNRKQYSPGELIWLQGSTTGRHMVTSQTASFIYEAMTWLAYVTLSGFLDKYPRLKMTIFESNASWLPTVLESCDRLFRLYARDRAHKGGRLPSEAFLEQCRISVESEEEPVFVMHEYFKNVAIWASDVYHHDGADAWEAIERMHKHGVPPETQARILSGNACDFYGIEPKTFITDRPSWTAPDWFPDEDEVRRAMRPETVTIDNLDPASFAGTLMSMAMLGSLPGADDEVH